MGDYFWKDKDKIVSEVLQPLFKLGLTVTKACKYAGIPQRTVQSWIEKDNVLRLKISVWQSEISLNARNNISKKIQDNDVSLSQWWLKLKEKDEFADRSEVVQTNISYEELKQMQEENLREAEEIKKSRIISKGLYHQLKTSKE